MAELTLESLAKRVDELEHRLNQCEANGALNPLLKWAGRHDPNDPEEQEFLEILAQQRRDDLEETLRELDTGCSNSSSTPTT
jgi:hypothetical protein